MATNLRVVSKRRETITALPLYHSGHLLKKDHKEKEFKNYYAELRGVTLFLYNDDTHDTYAERLELDQLKATDLDSLSKKKTQSILKLHLPTEEVHLKIENDSTREEWRGYILTVVKKEIPSKLELLRGQIVKLEETLRKEKSRKLALERPPLPPRPPHLQHTPTSPAVSTSPPKVQSVQSTPELPSCYFDVTREEAERMLDTNPSYGGIILRPSAQSRHYALTLRQVTPSGPVKNNFQVSPTKAGFVIKLDTPVTVSSLNEVLEYFLEKTEHRLRPFQTPSYDTRIEVAPVPRGSNVDSSSFKSVPQAHVAPMQRSQPQEEPPSPPAEEEQGDYLNPDDVNPKKHNVSPVRFDRDFQQHIVNKKKELRKVSKPFGVCGDYEN